MVQEYTGDVILANEYTGDVIPVNKTPLVPKAEEPKPTGLEKFALSQVDSMSSNMKAFGKEAVPLVDMALGFPAMLADYATKLSIVGAEGTAEAIEGKDIVPGSALKHARESVEASASTPVGQALHAPLRTTLDTFGITQPKKPGETTESYVEGAFEKITNAINTAGNYWEDVTGSEHVGEMVKFGAETAMVGAPLPLKHVPVGKAVSSVVDKVSKTGAKVKSTFIKPVEEPPVRSEEFEKSRIKPEESIPDVLQRKREREALVAKLEKTDAENQAKVTPEDTSKTSQEALQAPKEDTGIAEAQSKLEELQNPPETYTPKVAVDALDYATKRLEETNTKYDEAVKAEDWELEGTLGEERATLRIIKEKAKENLAGDNFSIVRNKGYIDVVELPKEYQKQGLGTKLVTSMEREMRSEGIKTSFLLSKESAIPFWEKQGYRINEGHVFEAGENVPMSKNLKQVTTPKEEVGGIAEQAAEVSKKPPLARTTKEGEVIIDHEAAKADFEAGFPYIFDADTPTGYQKQLVFERLQLSKDEFKSLIPDAETYTSFLKAHEESHVRNGDHASYPRDAQGKLDLTNPKAIEIESRATLDAIKEISQPKPEEIALENVHEFIVNENRTHGSVLQGVTDVLAKSANTILAKNRASDIFYKGVEQLLPNTKLRDKMTRAAEAERDYDKLLSDSEKARQLQSMAKTITKWEKQLPPEKDGVSGADRLARLKKVAQTLVDMGSEEPAIPVLKTITKRIADIGEQAKRIGLLTELRQNYIPHVLDWSKFKGTEAQKQSILEKMANPPKDSKLVRDFAERRTYEFLRELEKAVEGTGVVVLTDIAKVGVAYEKAMQTAIIHKAMFDYLKTNKAPDGKAWVVEDSPASKAAKYVSFEGAGTLPIRNLRVHPDLADAMGFLFRQTDPSIIVRTLGGISHLTKALNVVGSLFHAKSLMEAGFLTDPKLFVTEQVPGMWNKESKARQSLDRLRNGSNDQMIDLFIREGLMTQVEDVQKTIIHDTGKYLDSLASKALLPQGKELHLLQHITNPLDREVLQRLNTFTWDYMHAAQKLNVATHLFEKMKRKNPELSDAQVAREVSLYVNNTFGGLNWLEVANSVNNKFARAAALKMAGIAGREWAQIILFAPDWTVSTLRAVTSAAPKEFLSPTKWQLKEGVKGLTNPKTNSDLARRYVIHTALAWLTIIEGINLATSGHSVWENKDPTRIELADGTSMQAAKHSMEAVHWMTNPDKTLGNKLGFWPKALFVSTTGVAYPSPTAPKLKDTSILGRTKAVATLAAPFQVSSAIQAPEGEKLKRAVTSSLGVPIYGVPRDKMAEAIRKGKMEAKKKRLEEKLRQRGN